MFNDLMRDIFLFNFGNGFVKEEEKYKFFMILCI